MIRPLLISHQLHWISVPQVFHQLPHNFGFLMLRPEDLTRDHLTRPYCIEARRVTPQDLGHLELQEPI